jgi:beta-hydroxyacyl-ACP dehydratase FabZ
MDIKKIMNILPHRYPFLLVDKVVEINKEYVRCIKNVTINEEFFNGHFPGEPVMPGVLIVEALAQAGGLVAFTYYDNLTANDVIVYFMGFDNVKFRKPVVPGDVLELCVSIVKRKGDIWKMRGEAFVDGKLVCEADLMAMLKRKE